MASPTITTLDAGPADAPLVSLKTLDIYMVGVGGQGILTIGELIAEAAFRQGIPVNFYPTKGMAQRGGFVKAQLRLGRALAGPAIPERSADLVIATELSESLKALRYVRPDGDFLLYAYVWPPTAVMLGKAPYPSLAQAVEAAGQALSAGGRFCCIDPADLPAYEGASVPDNVYTLAVALKRTCLGRMFAPEVIAEVLRTRWKRGVERNMFAFQAGLADAARAPA